MSLAALCAAIAAEGLGTCDGEYPEMALVAREWAGLLAEANAKRLTGLLWAAVQRGAFPVTEEQEQDLQASQLEAMVAAVELEALLLDVLDLFDAAGIDSRVIKGSASAHLLYPDPALRPFGDVDILVPAAAMTDACRTLAEAGRRRFPEPLPSYDREFGKGVSMVMPGSLEVDLHRTLSPGPYGLLVHLDDLFVGVRTFPLGGREVPALGPDLQLLSACYHAVLGSAGPPLTGLRDVVQILTTTEVGGTTLELARRWKGEAVLAKGILEAWAALCPTEEPELVAWARAHRPGARDRRWLRAASGPTRSSPRMALQGLEAIPGLAPRLRYMHAVIAPRDPANPRRRRWRRGWDELAPTGAKLRGARGRRRSS